MNKTFLCDKIIRNNDPKLFEERGIHAQTRTLRRDEIVPYLKKKIKEEASEAYSAETPEDTLNELVDVYEAGCALCEALGISEQDFFQLCKAKRQRKGNFDQHICLESVTIPDTHPEIEHYLSQPEKYPQQ